MNRRIMRKLFLIIFFTFSILLPLCGEEGPLVYILPHNDKAIIILGDIPRNVHSFLVFRKESKQKEFISLTPEPVSPVSDPLEAVELMGDDLPWIARRMGTIQPAHLWRRLTNDRVMAATLCLISPGLRFTLGRMFIDTTMSTSLLETLPITLSGNYTWNYLELDSVTTGDKNDANLQLGAEGTIGTLCLNTLSHLNYSDNILAETTTLGGGSSLILTIPVISMFAIEGSITPLYNRTDYKASDTFIESTNLDSSLGGIITFKENIIGKIGGTTTILRTKSTTSSDDEKDLYSWSLGGFPDLDIQKISGFYLHPAYTIKQEILCFSLFCCGCKLR